MPGKKQLSKNAFLSGFFSLPIELRQRIIPDPAVELGLRVDKMDSCGPGYQGMCCVPIKRKGKPTASSQRAVPEAWHKKMKREKLEKQEPVRALLFALSHTCRALRAYCLPLLWRVLHVGTVDELGSLRDLFRASPSLATHVKHFSFTWDMGGELCNEDYDREINAKPGETVLGLAFTDRVLRAHRVRRRERPQLYGEDDDSDDYGDLDDPFYDMLDEEHGGMSMAYAHHMRQAQPKVSVGRGPDGNGQDKRIADASELNDCLTEVISRFSRLEAFDWSTFVMSVPEGVMAHLEKLDTLQYLWSEVYFGPAHPHELPLKHSFWRCSKNLRLLTIEDMYDRSNIEREVLEADVWAAQDYPPPTYEQLTDPRKRAELKQAQQNYRKTLHMANTRTVINAAKGGKLRTLKFGGTNDVYAIRSLLPAWVGVEQWDSLNGRDFGPYLKAAASLRASLAHASRTMNGDKSHQRSLTAKQVQDMPAALLRTQGGVPEFEKFNRQDEHAKGPHPLQAYFKWLKTDAQLAAKVAEAWNQVVKRGEANKVQCFCKKCEAL